MIGIKILLDTNIITALFKGEESIAEKIDKAGAVYIPAIVAGELYYGAFYSQNIEKNRMAIERLIDSYTVLPLDEKTSKQLTKTNQKRPNSPLAGPHHPQ